MSTNRGAHAATVIGNGPRMQAVREFIQMNADDITPLIISGEEGTGRRFIARLLHESSPRRRERLTAVRGAGLSIARLEGYLGDSGTVVLEGIDAMTASGIDALLRRLNGEAARLIATAGTQMVLRPRDFRLVLPPLRDRREDIAALTDLFLSRVPAGHPPKPISPAARDALQHYDWPGNLRELQQMCDWIARTCSCAVVRRGCLPARLQHSEAPAPAHDAASDPGLDPQVRHFEAELIVRALMETGYNRSRAARLLNIKRSTLGDRIRRLGIAEDVHEEVA